MMPGGAATCHNSSIATMERDTAVSDDEVRATAAAWWTMTFFVAPGKSPKSAGQLDTVDDGARSGAE
jgi:hypothetical protein